jgi:ribosomal silencing factor RsfS
MSQGIISKLIEEIGEAQTEARAEEYTMVNVRPGEKVSAMLELVAALSGKSASALVAEVLSSRLAEYAASSIDRVEAIMDAAEEALKQAGMFQPGCALDNLERADLLKVENGCQKQLRERLSI